MFCASRTGDAEIAKRDCDTWFKIASKSHWENFAALKQTFRSADKVDYCVVFDVGNNRYRLIAIVNFAQQTLYIRRVMDHPEYDKNLWPDQCGCRTPLPSKMTSARGTVSRKHGKKEQPKGG
ncbi:type II toxin-antitoxin system HigB family toxin [Aquisphaera insulae]|uniref:type II toxin-antitoxin system HigB family toxin n=1 Tax=Aquisphaera insulae TaxID=2712864 RepID=UPI0013EC5635|nr:type II toxin-antitoxin system HigB family toxin [Aquisphaera insulae]